MTRRRSDAAACLSAEERPTSLAPDSAGCQPSGETPAPDLPALHVVLAQVALSSLCFAFVLVLKAAQCHPELGRTQTATGCA